ncbi:MAG: DinB family protein [Terriglobales bacterium]
MRETLERMFRYNEWANREAIASLRAASSAPAKAVQLLAHIVAAEWLWLERIEGVRQSYAVWPDWTLEQIESEVSRSSEGWRAFLGECDAAALDREFEYTNSKGKHFRNKVGDAAMHVAIHGAYHRGQIALLLRQHGAEPAYTDFIQAVREEGI